MLQRRGILIVMDGVGIGELPDARQFDDTGTHSLLHVAQAVGGLDLPTLEALGLGNASQVPSQPQGVHPEEIPGLPAVSKPLGAWGKMAAMNPAKDSVFGHWELMGCIPTEPFAIFADGFPPSLVKTFEERIGIGVLGNVVASGTRIIDDLGEEHMKTKKPILYTSADSVFQVAAHEEVIPVERLHDICKAAREVVNPFNVGRVIARPFVGAPGNFKRTENRRDYSVPPSGQTLLDLLAAKSIEVVGLGKISDLFAGRGVVKSVKTTSNPDTMTKLEEQLDSVDSGLLFANCGDTDTAFGHRRDTRGYAAALRSIDQGLEAMLPKLTGNDLLVVTADHGCDPTLTRHTDHTREYVPLLAYSPAVKPGTPLGLRDSFADVGKTLADWFGTKNRFPGQSFLSRMLR